MHEQMGTLIFLFNLMTKDSFKLDHLAVMMSSNQDFTTFI